MFRTAVALVVATLTTSIALGAADFRVTEIYAGLSGEDGTEDWIEVTNFGDMAGDTGTLIYDDESLDPTAGGDLSSIILQPGESAVFITSVGSEAANQIALFEAIWGTGAKIGTAAGGGGLSQGGDTAAILLSDGTVVDALTYNFNDLGLSTIDDSSGTDTPVLSVIGVNGAYESNPFFNDNIGGPNNMVTLIGSPGIVPEPTSVLMCLIGLATLARRR